MTRTDCTARWDGCTTSDECCPGTSCLDFDDGNGSWKACGWPGDNGGNPEPVTDSPTPAPTKQPTKAPTKAPTPPPTKAPTKKPTPPPTKAPTKNPTPPPTNAPIVDPTPPPSGAPTPAPTPGPTSDNDTEEGICCSWNLATCGDSEWCNAEKSNCEDWCEGIFIDPSTRTSCQPRWEACSPTAECCEPSSCIDFGDYFGCGLPGDNGDTTTDPPTNSPDTPAPVPAPTPSPTDSPSRTPSGAPTPATTPGPTSDDDVEGFCCSWDLAICGDDEWCNAAKSNCELTSEEGCGGVFIDPSTRLDCQPRWQGCSSTADCCEPASCIDFGEYVGCGLPGDGITTDLPTTPPAPTPTSDTPAPTPTPAPPGTIPPGPYITADNSSERVVIPDPPTPSLGGDRTNCPHLASDLVEWNDSWTGSVTLPANTNVVVRSTVPSKMGVVTIPQSSSLIFGENANGINLDLDGMDVQGSLIAGSETCRIETPVTITLHGSRPADAVSNPRPPTYKGVSVEGEISLHGQRYYRTWTRLAKTVEIGEDVIVLQHEVNWEPGQEIVLVTSAVKDSREWHQNEVLTISSVVVSPVGGVGAAVFLDSPVSHRHTANGHYQAEVGLLSRTIKVQGASSDSEPTDPDPLNCNDRWIYGNTGEPCSNTELTGFGGHIMVQDSGIGQVEGVELYRMGQTNVLGRYPIHFHLLGDCPDCYFRDSSVHRSYYRCISIHGTNYATATENVAYDVTGYCYYLEDGVEQYNTISFNLGAHIHLLGPEAPTGFAQTTDLYQQSNDLTLPADVSASAFYITNVRNHVIGNAASGGWAGFAFPNLPEPLGPHRGVVNMRPSTVLPLTIDGNTAHSTGWWWFHAGAFYLGGSLYYRDDGVLEYNPGRDFDFNNHGRSTCTINPCETGNCGNYCAVENHAWVRLTNSKAWLVPSVGLNSWTGRIELVGMELADTGLAVEALSGGAWIDNMLVVCRSGEELILPPGGSASFISGSGFQWYDTGQEHIISNSVFRNCGFRSDEFNQYDTSPTRGCGADSQTGCDGSSYVFSFLSHSDQFNPEIMQATKNIDMQNCGRRFRMNDFRGDNAPISVSARLQNWLDQDGSITGFGVPSVIASGYADAGLWWEVDNEVVDDEQGPLKFYRLSTGPERGLGHIKMFFDRAQHDQSGGSICTNGGGGPCPALGYIRHLGERFESDPGLPVTAEADVAGPVGGFGWLLELNEGAPKELEIRLVEVNPDTPMLLSIAYPPGTSFVIAANADFCTPGGDYLCREEFTAVGSVDAVRASLGNTYHVDGNGVLTFRIIQTPQTFLGTNEWFLPTYEDEGRYGVGFALNRFERDGVLLPQLSYGPFMTVTADCAVSGSNSAYCAQVPSSISPAVCPPGHQQVAYDRCCSASNPSQCVFADGSFS